MAAPATVTIDNLNGTFVMVRNPFFSYSGMIHPNSNPSCTGQIPFQ